MESSPVVLISEQESEKNFFYEKMAMYNNCINFACWMLK